MMNTRHAGHISTIYRMKSTGYSSRKFGACEVCGEHASEVLIQTRLRRFHDELGAWEAHAGNLFGHESCLRRKEAE